MFDTIFILICVFLSILCFMLMIRMIKTQKKINAEHEILEAKLNHLKKEINNDVRCADQINQNDTDKV